MPVKVASGRDDRSSRPQAGVKGARRMIASKVVATSSLAGASGGSTSAARSKPGSNMRTRPEKVDGEDHSAALILSLSSPSRCTGDTVQQLLFLLDTTLADLNLRLLHRSEQHDGKVASIGRPAVRSVQISHSPLPSKANLVSKQAVNAVIASLNTLVTAGWKADQASKQDSCSRASSATSSRGRGAAAAVSTTSQAIPATHTLTIGKVLLLFDCFRIAIRHLLLTSTSPREIESIVVGVVRKTIALDLWQAASAELMWLREERFSDYFCRSSGLNNVSSIERQSDKGLLLDVQALSFACDLALAKDADVTSIVDEAINAIDGPLSSLTQARRSDHADVEALDRVTYAVERSIMRCASIRAQTLTFMCRTASLKVLLTVSELDMEAFWDRLTRIGVSQFRSPEQNDVCAAFEQVDALYKDICVRVQQRPGQASGSSNGRLSHSHSGAFRRLCDAWTYMARKAGDVDALRSIALITQEDGFEASGSSGEQADTLLVQLCAHLSAAEAALAKAHTGGDKGDEVTRTLEEVEGRFRAAVGMFAGGSSHLRRKVLQEVGRIRRHCSTILEYADKADSAVRRRAISVLLGSATLVREQVGAYRAEESTEELVDRLDEYIRTMRFVAKTVFAVSDAASHKTCADALHACDSLLAGKNASRLGGRGADVCEWKRSLSISWHYIGAQLYSNKEPGLSIVYLERAARLATESHEQWTELSQARKEAFDQQYEALPKRWEHLAMAYRLTSQPSQAEEAILKAVQYVPPATWSSIATQAQSKPATEIFHVSRKGDQIYDAGHLVKLAFELQAFDLLKIQKAESTVFDLLSSLGLSKGAIGAILEYCISGMDKHLHREESAAVYSMLLDLGGTSYAVDSMPLRRTRIMLLRLEMLILQGGKCDDGRAAMIVKELSILTNTDELGEDQGLVRFQKQYKGILCLYRMILAGRTEGVVSGAVKRLEEEASCFLGTSAVKQDAPAKTPITTKKGTLRHTSAPRQRAVGVPKTPVKPSNTSRTESRLVGRVEGVPASAEWDDPDSLLRLLELVLTIGANSASGELLRVAKAIACRSGNADAQVQLSTMQMQRYLDHGRTTKALSLCQDIEEVVSLRAVSSDTHSRFLFAHADLLSRTGDNGQAIEVFHRAVDLAEQVEAKKAAGGLHGAIQRVLLSERQTIAFGVFAQIHFASGRMTLALGAALSGVRSAMRVGMTLARLVTRDSETDSRSPFDQVSESDDETSELKEDPGFPSNTLLCMHGRAVQAMLTAYSRLSHLYVVRGSAKDAEAFAGEGVQFARNANAPQALTLALLERGGLRLRMGKLSKAMEDVDLAATNTALEGMRDTLPSAVLAYVRGEHFARARSYSEAGQAFLEGRKLLLELEKQHLEVQPELDDRSDTIVPLLQVALLQRYAWLMHLTKNDDQLSKILQESESRLGERAPGQLALTRGLRAVRRALKEVERDQMLNLVPDAVVSIPCAVTWVQMGANAGTTTRSGAEAATQAALQYLREARDLFDSIIATSLSFCTASTVLRDAKLQRSTCDLLMSAISARDIDVSGCSLAGSLTLKLETDESIEGKLADNSREGLGKVWPRFEGKRAEKANVRHVRPPKGSAMSASEGTTSEDESVLEARNVWLAAQQRRRESENVKLPPSWTVVSISLSSDRDCLLLERKSGRGQSVLFSIPINRQSRREGDEDLLNVDAVLAELRDIVEESNTATHSAHELDGLEGRKAWWTRRRELDARLKLLLTAIDTTWLGAFRCVLAPAARTAEANMTMLRLALNEILTTAFFPAGKVRKSAEMELNAATMDLFSALDMSTCSDEDLEDVVHFAMDAFQLQGVPVAVDEVDLDVCVTDMRSAFETFRNRRGHEQDSVEDEHIFLILDKDVSAIPWESVPSLRGRAVCRIPSLDALQDRLALAPDGRLTIPLSSSRKFFLLNPSQELVRTQDRFAPFFTGAETAKGASRWRGITGRSPNVDELGKALEGSDLLLYFGHGGAEQYIRPSRLRGMMRCAVTMLWGCSSGALADMGDFDRTGTAHNYLMAGCPSLVSLLWDATDKELDGVSESVLRLSGVIKEGPMDGRKGLSIAQAVARSRSACKLPYLTGAACVVYGVPVYFT